MEVQTEINNNDVALLIKAIQKENAEQAMLCYADFYTFFKTMWPELSSEDLVDNWHIKFICDQVQELLERAFDGLPKLEDAIFNVPPGSTKSSIITEAAPIWCWLHRPDFTVINSSYASEIAVGHALKSKEIFKSDRFKELFQPLFFKLHGKYIYLVKDTEKLWKNNFGGERQTTSTGGTITGKHADIILVDDSLSAEQAESEAEVKTCHRFHDRTLPSRFKNKKRGLTIYIMQRLIEDDTTGHELRKRKDIRHISLPAEINEKVRPKPEYVSKYYQDGLLDPVRFDREVLNKFKVELGSYSYSGQFLQDPVPEGGGKIKAEWLLIAEERMRDEIIEWMMFIDGAYTENTNNDPTGIFIVGTFHSVMYVLFAASRFMEIPELIVEIKSLFKIFPLKKQAKIYIEPKASGKSLKQLLVKDKFNAIEINTNLVQGGKVARCNVIIPFAEAGRVRLVRASWNEEVIYQLTRFPKAIHDEYIDLTGYSVDMLLMNAEDEGEKKEEINPSEFY